ncbi:hypothetical protein AVEN_52921-1 [Araneus ventricosus]|uniref:Uncharacterized protein n=1 Tax=Araneus ventricosus TaxID=182803 RepID=A0A4Y2FF69_ARAVE|nr:hypothetical protein AVEN_52921-1 [Araneus ventricosus]
MGVEPGTLRPKKSRDSGHRAATTCSFVISSKFTNFTIHLIFSQLAGAQAHGPDRFADSVDHQQQHHDDSTGRYGSELRVFWLLKTSAFPHVNNEHQEK